MDEAWEWVLSEAREDPAAYQVYKLVQRGDATKASAVLELLKYYKKRGDDGIAQLLRHHEICTRPFVINPQASGKEG